MNIRYIVAKSERLNKYNYLRFFNIAHQYLYSKKQRTILDAYARIKRSKNELEKSFNEL